MSFLIRVLVLVGVLLSMPVNASSILIKNANVHTLGQQGQLTQTDVLIVNDKIKAVGKNLSQEKVDAVIDGTGKHLTPGIMAVKTQLGVVEIGAIKQTVDSRTSDKRYSASFDIVEAFNPRSALIPQNRRGGVTRTLIMPIAGHAIFAGKGAIMSLNGQYDSVLVRNVGVNTEFGEKGAALSGGSRAAALMKLQDAFSDTREYMQHKAAVQKRAWRDLSLSINDLEALVPIIKRQTALIIKAHRASDILAVLRMAKREKVRVVIEGASEAWMVAGQLKAANVPVIIDPIDNLPSAFEKLGVRLDNAALLQKAGVKILFAGAGSQGTHNAYLVRQAVGNAVANGLDHQAAMQALFNSPADVFGSEKPVGKIEQGFAAELVLWDGDPLEITSEADQVIIDGQLQDLSTRSTRLRDRYLDIAGKKRNVYFQ